MTQRTLGQWRTGVWTQALKRSQLAVGTQQDDLAVADFDLQATVLRDIGETGDTVQGHFRLPRRHFSCELAAPREFSHLLLPRHERYSYSLRADDGLARKVLPE